MKKTVKILSLILVLAVFAAMAIGSGSGGSKDVKEPSSVTSNGGSAPSNNAGSGPSASAADPGKPAAPEVTIEEQVVLDKNGIKITAKSLETKGIFGPEIKLLIENNSDTNVTVQARNVSVNGYMVETMLSSDVAAGKKANDSLTFMSSDIDTAGITTIADMEFAFHVFDSVSWDTIFDSDTVRIETSAADGYTYTFDDSGTQVYNENGIEIVVKGLAESDSWLGPSVVVYIYNSSNKDFTVQVRDVSVNGFMLDPIFSSDVVSGKHAIDTITFMSSEIEENGIETIENIELSFHVFNMDTWDTIVDTAPVVINFK